MLPVADLQIRGKRGLEIRRQLGENGHDIAPLRQTGENFPAWLYGNETHCAAKHAHSPRKGKHGECRPAR